MRRRILITTLLCIQLALADKAPVATFDYEYQLPTLQKENPAHYAVITRILEQISAIPVADVPSWLVSTFGVGDPLFLPTQKYGTHARYRLAFTLGGVRYDSTVSLKSFSQDKIYLKP